MVRTVNFRCILCGVNHVSDSNSLGDYYQTEWDYVLQNYCPICGRMEPLIVGGDRFSRKRMKDGARFFALEFGWDFDICKSIARTSDGVDFIHLLSIEFNLPEEIVSSVINNGSDENALAIRGRK